MADQTVLTLKVIENQEKFQIQINSGELIPLCSEPDKAERQYSYDEAIDKFAKGRYQVFMFGKSGGLNSIQFPRHEACHESGKTSRDDEIFQEVSGDERCAVTY